MCCARALKLNLSSSTPHSCGGGLLSGNDCPAGFFCEFPAGSCTDGLALAAGPTGTCKALPELCSQEINPVCGCDGESYTNACMAKLKGVSIKVR